LVIMDHGQLAGMLTFREIIRYLHKSGGSVGNYTVRSIMDDAPVSVSPNTGFEEVQRLMLEKHARYLPVMDGPTLLGWRCSDDMAASMVAPKAFDINMPAAYIRDRPGHQASLCSLPRRKKGPLSWALFRSGQCGPGEAQQLGIIRGE